MPHPGELQAARHQHTALIEANGIEPVPLEQRRVGPIDLFALTANFQISPGMIIIGGLAVSQGLSFWNALLAVIGGMLTAVLCYLTMATIGVDYGIPGQVATRMAFGIRGSKLLPSLLRAFASVYWFAFQTVSASLGVVAVLGHGFGIHVGMTKVTLVFGIVQVVVAVVGYNLLKHLSQVALPVKLVALIWMLWAMASHAAPGFAPHTVFAYSGHHGAQWPIAILWFNTAIAGWLTVITDAADFCRYSTSRQSMWVSTALGSFCGVALSTIVGAYAAAATLGGNINPFDVVSSFRTGGVPALLLLLVIVFDSWTINGLNLYTGGLSVANIFDRFGRFRATLLVSALGIVLSMRPDVVTGYTGFVEILGSVFAPIAGILLADYLLIHRMRVDVPALFDLDGPYMFSRGFHIPALVWIGIGAILVFVVPPVWPVPVLAVLITGLGYYGTVRITRSIKLRPLTPFKVDSIDEAF
jgi:nucleobase:cation symporter-1, NCS1 family